MIAIKSLLLFAVLVSVSNAQRIQNAAAAPAPGGSDCLCQCISLQFIDSRGRRQGNCRSTFNGAQWCYVKYDRNSPCFDLRRSRRFRGRYWSYQACATPPENSPICRNVFPPPFFYSSSSSRGSVQAANVPDNVY